MTVNLAWYKRNINIFIFNYVEYKTLRKVGFPNMKIGKSNRERTISKPDKNSGKKNILLILVVLVTIALIVWVYSMGRKAEETVAVAMYSTGMYKGEAVGPDTFIEYNMLKGEFEKYATTDDSGNPLRRIVLAQEANDIIQEGAFAAYQTQPNTIAMWNDFVTSRVDNRDTVLYSYPGKNILTLNLSTDELGSFKTFLQTGDRINVTAIFKTSEAAVVTNADGSTSNEAVEVFRQEQVFNGIMIADMLNGSGESILDKYAYYNSLSIYDQAALDNDESWQAGTQSENLLVALTPEEETRYYQYLSKEGVQFHMSLPQRVS